LKEKLQGSQAECVFKFASHRYRVKNVVAIHVLANYKLWQLLIPRDDLGAVFRVMVFLSMGHERPVRRPETIAFWRYLCKKEETGTRRGYLLSNAQIYIGVLLSE
jgi:hypothetical protein